MSLDAGLDALSVGVEAPPHVMAPQPWKQEGWKVTITPDGAELSTNETSEQLVAADDWDGVLRHFGLNPEEFCIADDTVRMSSWQQSKGLEDGSRDTITLYSYRARFRRVTDRLPEAALEDLRKHVRKWKAPARKTPGSGLGAPSTFYVGWADWQLGKEGTREFTTQRILDSFEQSAARVKELRKIGRNVTGLAIANMGDPVEGCYGNYASQQFTVEMNTRDQMLLALDLWVKGITTLAPMFDDVQVISVLCNHGEIGRGDNGKQQTSASDNMGGLLPSIVKRELDRVPALDHIQWKIPRSEMNVMSVLSGVPVAFTHGHKAPADAALAKWMSDQSIILLREHGEDVRIWMTAHRHHYSLTDIGNYWRIQHPALDTGSKWFTDMTGKYSAPGTFTCLIGEHEQAGGPISRKGAHAKGRGFSDEFMLMPAA